MSALTFDLPAGLEADAPPDERDHVRLLIATATDLRHAMFGDLAGALAPGDLVVVNTSATLPAAVDGVRADGRTITVHFATALDDGSWVVEVRPRVDATGALDDVVADEPIALPDGVRLVPLAPHPEGQHRLWRAQIHVEGGVVGYLHRVGRPIRYAYVPRQYPFSAYQTVFAREPGSAEMPSAGRPFTTELVTDLVVRGIALAPIVLHTGVSSQEPGEPPQPERFVVPAATARQVDLAHAAGNRVVAVGTTVARALESAADTDGVVRGRGGWTELVLGPDRPARVIDGLITGWHAPGASHLDLLTAVAGAATVQRAYVAALDAGYRWHEFGDSCLLLR